MLEMTINRTVESENSDRYYESEHYEPEENQFNDAPSDPEPIPDSPDSPSYTPSDTPSDPKLRKRRQNVVKTDD